MRILWPNIPPEFEPVARDAIGPGFEPIFCARPDDVTDEQWANADAIVGPNPPAAAIEKLRKCRIFVKSAVGYDEVDLERFGRMGIPVCDTPDYGTREVADHAIALMLTLAKSISYHDGQLRENLKANWRPAHNPFGHRLSSCVFGVVGIGRIGTAAARRAKAFDMDVVFHDPYQPNGYELALGIRRADTLADLMGQCDFVSIHAAAHRGDAQADRPRCVRRGQARHDPGQHRARPDRRYRRALRCDARRHGARRRVSTCCPRSRPIRSRG